VRPVETVDLSGALLRRQRAVRVDLALEAGDQASLPTLAVRCALGLGGTGQRS
jgi:hypothetical protein